MANNLTPEQIRQLQAYYANGSGLGLFQDGGRVIQSNANPGTGMDSVGATPATEYYGYDPSQTMPGQSYDRYGIDGSSQGQGQFTNDPNELSAWDLAAMIAIGGGAAYGAGMFGGAGAGAASGAGGPGSAGWGMDLGGAGLADTTYAANIGGAGLSEAGLAGEGAFTGTNALGGAATGSGIGGATAAGAAASAMPGWVKPAVTLAGGLLGSQGESESSEITKRMDPEARPYIFGGNGQTGLLPFASGLLGQQMTPERQQGFIDMQTKGRGLLDTQMAGNGFERFAGRKF